LKVTTEIRVAAEKEKEKSDQKNPAV